MITIILIYENINDQKNESDKIELRNVPFTIDGNRYFQACINIYLENNPNLLQDIKLDYYALYDLFLLIIPGITQDIKSDELIRKNNLDKIYLNSDETIKDIEEQTTYYNKTLKEFLSESSNITELLEKNKINFVKNNKYNGLIIEDKKIKYFIEEGRMFEDNFKKLKMQAKKKKDLVLFSYNKSTAKIEEIENPDFVPHPANKTRTIADIVNDQPFLTILKDLFISEGNIVDPIKSFFEIPDAQFSSNLLAYRMVEKKKHINQFIFIRNTPEKLYFMIANKAEFIRWNNQFMLIEPTYATEKTEYSFKLIMNNITYRYDIFEKNKPDGKYKIVLVPALRMTIQNIFVSSTERLSDFFGNVAPYKLNEYSFFFDKMCTKVSTKRNTTNIENFKSM